MLRGSSIATPLLAVLAVPGSSAVASPLPATMPPALGAAGPNIRRARLGPCRRVDAPWRPPSSRSGRPAVGTGRRSALLIASGLVLVVVGERVLRPIEPAARSAGCVGRKNHLLLVAASAGVGPFTGLLAKASVSMASPDVAVLPLFLKSP